jgi:catechol 2,3-dioxygenase-like lactoylglutathione lyase family enzyme
MPAIRRVLESALYCDDLAGTSRVYRDVLGLRVHFADARLIAFDAGGSTVLLLFARGESRMGMRYPGGMIPGHDGSGPVHIAFAVSADELADWEDRLAANGVDIESRVDWERGGRSIYFRDPDGHSVELVTPGVWPTY